ncbi:hypothetical protein IJI69_04895 [Candidatus Saccharibacteria bacterium]|nr:hypothetical protein [Candidatus Saccharibacteria bacterium]
MARRRVDRRYFYLAGILFVIAAVFGFLRLKNLETGSAANAKNFNPGNIMTDKVMGDYNSMTEAEIQAFLKSKNSCNDTNVAKAAAYPKLSYHIENGHFVCMADEKFNGETAAHIIWQAAQDYHINPKVLIVLLEKEQGLVTDTWPNSTLQYRSATGYGCPDTAACDSQYYGFKNQIRNSAKFFRKNLDGDPNWTNYPVGVNNVLYNPNWACGSSQVNIQNRATGALYTYTPYQPNAAALNAGYGIGDGCSAYGNRNFYLYFTDWFGSTTIDYPKLDTIKTTNRIGNVTSDYKLSYRTSIEYYGWLDWQNAGEMSGSTGYAMRLDGLQIKLPDGQTGIEYRTHVSNIGWQNYVKDGATAGSVGSYEQIEAVQIRLTGELAKTYDIYYRTHVADIGWQDWVKNDAIAGTTGKGKRVEAIQIKLVKKGQTAGTLTYQAHTAYKGWMSWVKGNAIAGTTGESRQMEALNIKLSDNTIAGSIRYKAHVADIGWQDWVNMGATAGTTGKGKRMEAIMIELTGDLKEKYDVYYRAHVANIGWQDWVKNGAVAGTTGKSLQIEAVQIKLVAK